VPDRVHNPIFNVDPEEEIFGKQVKATQLQRLFSNIPGDQKKARGDKARLKEASRGLLDRSLNWCVRFLFPPATPANFWLSRFPPRISQA
jgi:hypothetical protein